MKPGIIQLLTQGATFATWMFVVVVAKEELSLDDTSIAVVAAAFAATTFISNYVFGRASDIYGRRIFLWLGLITCSVAFLLQNLMFDFWSYLGLRMLTGVALGIYPAALIAYVHESKGKLGNFSSYGAIGWLIAMITAGIIAEAFFLRSVFYLSSFMFAVSFVFTLGLPSIKHKRIKVPLFPKDLLKKNSAVYLGILIRHSGANLMWVFWPLYLQNLGANYFWIGIITGINAVTQALVMYFIVDRIDCKRSIYIGLFLSGITFISFAAAQNYYQLLPTQLLLGASYAFMYVGALIYLNQFNKERGTAIGLLGSTLNLSSIIGSLFAVILIAIFGDYRWIILFAALMAFIALGVFWLLIKKDENVCIPG